MLGWRISLLLAVLALAVGLWAGNAWHKGRTAIAQNAELVQRQKDDRDFINALKNTATELRQHAVDGALAYDQATERMDAIAQQLEKDREGIRQFQQRQAAALDALAEARPDLRDLRLGGDVLRHWRASNAGPAADQPAAPAAAAPAAGEPAGDVPPAPAAGKRPSAGAAGQPRPGDGPVPRVRGAERGAAAGSGRVDDHRVALVLRRGAVDGPGR